MTNIMLTAALLLLTAAGCGHDAGDDTTTPAPDATAHGDSGCGVVGFCLPFLAADTHSFNLCASPEAGRTPAGAAYEGCVIASVSAGCSAACAEPRGDMGNPCAACARAACASQRAACD